MFNKKILCVGDNSRDTDLRVTNMAIKDTTVNHGLIDSDQFRPEHPGYYHVSLPDLSAGGIITIAEYFDSIVMLDQPYEAWSHHKILLSTYRLMTNLESLGHDVVYKQNQNIQVYENFFADMLEKNKSFCMYPWIERLEEGERFRLCARSIANPKILTDHTVSWQENPNYKSLRQRMLAGERLPKYCSVCYDYESKGIESYRQFESKEWISKLNIQSVNDLYELEHPYYYEVRLNNKCNLACRGCRPSYSSRIEEEYKKFNITYPGVQSWDYSTIDIIDIDTLTSASRVYLTGGEPTVMRDVYEFMERCIALGKTDFDFTIGTNAAVISKKFLNLSEKFTNMNFSTSLDGYGKINDYWRWGSDWDQVIANTKALEAQGHTISINCVPGIYNVTNLHLLFEFLDQEFPQAGMYLQLNYNDEQSAYNHPNAELVLESMRRCQQTKTYYVDGKSVKTGIDSLIAHYSNNPVCDLELLKGFFDYNDQMDRARNVRLADYIPELEECRKYLSSE